MACVYPKEENRMGILIDGKWHAGEIDTKKTGGRFIKKDSQFRNWITKDGSAGPTGSSGFKAQAGRYHLYVSLACPWANRTLIVRTLKGLEELVSISIVSPYLLDNGWSFDSFKKVTADPVIGAKYLYPLYTHVDPHYSGSVTVPVLYDLVEDKIINNESSEIIRIFNTAFDDLGAKPGNYYPEELQKEIDEMNDLIYPNVNLGVYKAGFATSQTVYEREVKRIFTVLDQLEEHLADHDYLVGDRLTEADIHLFTTLIRFDSVYYGHFKCNIKQIVNYPNLWRYTRKIYHLPAIKETIDFEHIKHHYYGSHKKINPNGIIPLGPDLDLSL